MERQLSKIGQIFSAADGTPISWQKRYKYCQQFQGEIAPLDMYTTTHGICPDCNAKGMGRLDSEIGNSHRVRDIQELLYDAGKTGDVAAAAPIVQRALTAGLRPLDIMFGLITLLLYLIGTEWESHLITVADEHRFTSFFEAVRTREA